MAESYRCMVCYEEYDGAPHKTVHDLDLCADCVKESVIPLFHKALKYETHFPAKLGENKILNPRDFLEYFDDGKAFLDQWLRKEREYLTPYKMRVYCSDCGKFLLSNPKDAKANNVVCDGCLAFTCTVCHANTTVEMGSHVCKPEALEANEPAKRMEGLERGKHYQLCPNEECQAVINLMDGCNHIVCEGCRTNFCYLCGQEAQPDSGHWTVGCPRYNRADENPLYDEEEDEDEEDDPFVREDLLLEALGDEEYERRIRQMSGVIYDLPDLPDLTGMTVAQQIAAEEAMQSQLDATPLGQLRLQHRREVEDMIALAQLQMREDAANDVAVEDTWSGSAVHIMQELLRNLDVYIYRVRPRHESDAFEERDMYLRLAHSRRLQFPLFLRFRRLFEILHVYGPVFEHRLNLVETARSLGRRNEQAIARAREMERERQMGEREREREELQELEERERQMMEEVREMEREREVAAERTQGEDNADAPRLETTNLLLDAIGPEAYHDLAHELSDEIDNLPALPDLTTLSEAHQLAAEEALVPELERTPLGQAMLSHRRALDRMSEQAEILIAEAEDAGFAPPAWTRHAANLIKTLYCNLDVYIYRVHLRIDLEAYAARHDILESAYNEHQAQIFAHFRDFYEILAPYTVIAMERFVRAAEERAALIAARARATVLDEVAGEIADARRIVVAADRQGEGVEDALDEAVDALDEAVIALDAADAARRRGLLVAAGAWLQVARSAAVRAGVTTDEEDEEL